MVIRFFLICSFLMVLSGCIYNDEPVPEIVHDYSSEKLQPDHLSPSKPSIDIGANFSKQWLPLKHMEKNWTAVVVHHSATKNGSAAIFDKWHKESRNWQGVGYDFVIGNGTNSSDGQVEATYRWRQQKTGAHCGGTAGNWANEEAVGICLVGDFNKTVPTQRQIESLVKLIRFLQNRYGISKNRIYGHNSTPGARATDCPGRKFPMATLKSMLDN